MRYLGTILTLAMLVGACSSPSTTEEDEQASGSDADNPMKDVPELAELNEHLDHPDGSLSPEAVARFYPREAGLDSPAMILRVDFSEVLQATVPLTTLNCPALDAKKSKGTCECPSGGSFSYDVDRTEGEDGLVHIVTRRTFSNCTMREEGGRLAGTFFNHRYLREGSASFNEQNATDVTLTSDGQRYRERSVTRLGRETVGPGDDFDSVTIDVGFSDASGWIVWSSKPLKFGPVTAIDSTGRWTCEKTKDNATCTPEGGGSKVSRD